MLYLEHKPAPPLAPFVRIFWYARAPRVDHARERVLPTGCAQVILNLARDYLLDCPEGELDQISAPSLVVGARSIYEIVDLSDMADLIGIVFQPGGLPALASDAADRFSNRTVSLEDVWGAPARSLRDHLRELSTPEARLRCLEAFLLQTFGSRLATFGVDHYCPSRRAMVDFALNRFSKAPSVAMVRDVARSTGWSERRFSHVFREEVGLTPKVWCRIQRFQRAVRALHAGADVPWSELSLQCGFYDQSHFANEFRAFSGIDATTYSARRTIWANHVAVETAATK